MFQYRLCSVVLVLLGALFFAASYLLPAFLKDKLEEGIANQLVWKQDSPDAVYGRFERDNHVGDPPDLMRFWFLNITNLREVQEGGKPHLEEVGPYAYHKHRQKVDVWFNREGLVQFKVYEYLLPHPELSIGNATSDVIVTANIPLLGALARARAISPQVEMLVAGAALALKDSHNAGIFLRRTPGELLFGYEDPLLAAVQRWLPSVRSKYWLVANDSSPHWAKQHNALNKVDTGLNDMSRLWQQVVWENVSEVTSWNNHTEPVHGTDATRFSPGLGTNSSVTAWVGQIFRAARLVAANSTSCHGVELIRFVGDPALVHPDERYFQYVEGLMNITAPSAAGPGGRAGVAGPPLFMALPHFCRAGAALAANVSGLQCDPQRHEIYVDVEPTTGITMRAAKRLMLVTQLGPYHGSAVQPHVTNTFLPVMWAEEYSEISKDKAHNFRKIVYGMQAAIKGIKSYGFLAALACAISAMLVTVLGCFASGIHRKYSSQHGGQHDSESRSTLVDATAGESDGLNAPLLNGHQGTDTSDIA